MCRGRIRKNISVEINLFASIFFGSAFFSHLLLLPLLALDQLITLNHLVEMKWFFYPPKININ